MLRSIRVLLALAVLAAPATSLALLDGGGGYSGPQFDVRQLQVGCAYSQNDTATLRAAIEGGVAAGRTLFIPSGCKILLGSPGAGDSVADLPSNTTIQCEDGTAGFVLARKSCSAGSDAPGAACTADSQCHGGTCDPDYPAGGSFAPTEASTYTVFGAASGSSNPAIRNCSIWTNNASGAPQAIGGSGKAWGYCDGTGGSDVTGEACAVTCNSSSGVLYGVACTSDPACSPGACTEAAGTCKTGGGVCAAIPYETNFSAAGAGKINVIDFNNATGAIVQGVTIYDHRRGDQTIKVGTSGYVVDTIADARSLTVPAVGATWLNYPINASVTNGLVLGVAAAATRASASGWDVGIVASGGNAIEDSVGRGLGDASQSGWNGSTGLSIEGGGVIARGFVGDGGLNCIRPKFGLGYNFLVSQAYCDGQIGAKFIVSGSGNQYLGVRGAWGGKGAVVGLSDQRGRCAGGSRSTKVCVFGAGTDATIGCPSSTCNASDDFPAGSCGHFVIGGGTLLHTDQSNVDFIRTPDSKRCDTGTDAGGPCTTNSDCATGTCKPLRYTQGSIRDVKFYYGAGGTNTAINLNTSAISVDPSAVNSGGGPSIEDWTVDLALSNGFAAGIKFPSLARVCVGGSATPGTSCTADATCTGGGTCEAPVKNFVASGNVSNATTPFTNWAWSYGDISDVRGGLLATDEQPRGPITLTAGEALTRGQLVSVSTSADNAVVKTTTSNPERAVGAVLADTLSGYPARIITQGVGWCIADGTISNGDKLKPSGSTAGRVVAVSGSSDLIVASALDAATSGQTFDCLIGATPPIQNTTAAFPKFASTNPGTNTSFGQLCSASVQAASLTYTATSGRTILLVADVQVTAGSVKRAHSVELQRGGTNCDTGSPTTLATYTTTITASDAGQIAASTIDTGQSGSVTYRLCLCADTAANAGTIQTQSVFRLMEY